MTDKRHDIDTFSKLLTSVYDSAADPACWQTFLEGLAGALNAKSGLFRLIDERGRALRAGIEYNLDPELQHAYREYYVTMDPVVEALAHQPDVYIAPGEAFIDYRQLERTEFFNDYARPQDNVYLCGGIAMRNDEFTIKFGVQRDRKTGPFSKSDADFIRLFVPHIQRAARLGNLLQLTRHEAESAERALECLSIGIVLVDEHDHIVHVNRTADAVLQQGNGVTQSNDRLCAARSWDTEPFRSMLARARERAEPGAAAVPQSILLHPDPGDTGLLVIACPLAPDRPGIRGPWPEVKMAVFISDLDNAGLLNHDLLRILYGLTPAESRLACALSHGHDLSALSDSWHVSRETLRSHLKQVLAKTGTSRQVELVRLLSGAPWNPAATEPVDATDATGTTAAHWLD